MGEVTELVDHLVFVEVLDDDIGKDDKLGKTSFEIHELLDKEGIVNQWVPLDNCKSGEVLISASFIPREINEPVQKSKDSNISISSTNQTELKDAKKEPLKPTGDTNLNKKEKNVNINEQTQKDIVFLKE